MRLGLNRRAKIRLFPAHFYPMRGIIIVWTAVFLCLSLIIWSLAMFNLRFRPLVASFASSRATRIANIAINEAVNKEIARNVIKYSDLVSLKTGIDGNIVAIEANMIKINQLKSILVVAVQETISNIETQEIRIPLGNIVNSDLFSGWGPRVKISLVPVSFTQVDFLSSFQSQGINQTKHEINLSVKVDVSILLPTGTDTTTVESTVPVAQTIIVGPIPESFTGIEGVTSDPPDSALNLVN